MNASKSIHVFCIFVVMTLATFMNSAWAGKPPACNNDGVCKGKETAASCPADCGGGSGGGEGGLGSAIPLDCVLGASWAPPPPDFPEYTVTDDKLGTYQDAVDKVNCEIGGPSIPWPIRLEVGGGNGRWANVRQVDIALGDFTLGGFEGPPYPDWVDPDAGAELKGLYPGIFRPAQEDTNNPGYPDMDDMDTIRLQVRPYRLTQTTESIHLLTPGKVYEMGMNFSILNVGIDRFSISVAAEHYLGNENFTGLACEVSEVDGKAILNNAPGAPMQDVSVYLWLDGPDADDFPDGYTVSTGVITPPTDENNLVVEGPPEVLSGERYAAVCSAVGPLVCGNPQAPSNCNFLGYVPVQFTMTAVMK